MADGVINPMRVDTSLLQGIAAANSAAQAKTSSLKSTGTTTSFSSALKSATTEKETTRPVEGRQYAEILSGPRAGMYVNTSGNARDGEAFILVKANGREQHIYGTGKDRTVVSSGGGEKSAATEKSGSTGKTTSTSTEKAPADEKTKQVEGRAYADILNGPRSGLYLNTSGNVRDGQTFALVMRDGREFHIYGTGKDRQIIGLRKPDEKTADDTKTAADTTTKTQTTANTGTSTTGSLVTDNPA
jgi:hypothetical protein